MSVCVVSCIFCIDDRSIYLYIVLGGYLRNLGAPSVQSCCTLYFYISAPTVYFLLIYHSAFRF